MLRPSYAGSRLSVSDYSERIPNRVSGIRLCAYFGLEGITMGMLESTMVADSKDSDGRTPLLWAAEGGHETVVKLLLGRDDVMADSKDFNGRTPLSWAAEGGQGAVVELL